MTNRYHYIDDQGNISDPLPLEALRKISLPPATKVLLEGSKQWITLGDVSQRGPVVFPPPPPTSQTAGVAASATGASPTQRASAFYPTFFLGLFLGVFGVHRFYLSKIGTGILQLVTFGGLGVWWLVDMITILLGKFKDKKGAVIPNVNPKVSWSVFAVVVIVGLASRSSDSGLGSNPTGASSVAESYAGDPQAAIRKKYAGVYETTSGSLTFAGGLGLFASGSYTLMFGQSGTKHSGTWTVEGSTIRLKGSNSGDTVLRILSSEQLAYERNGVEVIYTLKERQ